MNKHKDCEKDYKKLVDNEKIKAIIKQHADKGNTQYRECCDDNESASLISYWDGYRDCAYILLRELEDMQEEQEPISDELDIAAKESSRIERFDDTEVGYDLSKYSGFVEGALWKEQQIKKNAVVAECSTLLYANGDEVRYAVQYPKNKRPVESGDKVKIFLIKE